jgi:hypothetical protein
MEEIIEIKNFELQYDGMFHITWSDEKQTHEWYIYLPISDLIRMLEIEGITIDQVCKIERDCKPIKFSKVKLKYKLYEGRYLAWGFFDDYWENTLIDNYTVELFQGDSIKNHQHETILGQVELVDE